MKTRSSILTAAASLCLAGLLTPCASPSVAAADTVSGLVQAAPRRVLVLAVLGSPTSRRAIEDEVVRQLSETGINAVAGYSISPDTGDVPPQRLAQALAETGADTALVCRWHLVRQTRSSRSAGGVKQTAYGSVTLVDGSTLGTLWSAPTKSSHLGGFRDAAPAFASNLVATVAGGGALYCGNGVAPRSQRSMSVAASF